MACLPVQNPQLPFMGLIPGGLIHGRMIRINGFMLPNADRVSINVQTGPSIEDNEPLDDDICLHVDIRAAENEIVRNHFGADGWGYEERTGENPIQPGSNFELLILAQNDCFKIAINGNHFCEFKHRVPLASAQYLYVCRDANIFSITLEGDVPNAGQPSAPPVGGGYGPPQHFNPDATSLSYQGGPY